MQSLRRDGTSGFAVTGKQLGIQWELQSVQNFQSITEPETERAVERRWRGSDTWHTREISSSYEQTWAGFPTMTFTV